MEHAHLDLEHFLPYQLSVLSNRISGAIAAEYEDRHQLPVTEWRVIAVLGRFDGLSANEVAARTAMDKVAVSRAIARLIAAGRVRRRIDPADRRRSMLRLTIRGRAVFDDVVPRAMAAERRLLGRARAGRSARRWRRSSRR